MSIHDKDFECITEADLLQLIENKVPEGQRIEYKSDKLKPDQYSEQISAFANSSGGDLFIGITEKNGFPIEINGILLDNPDAEILKLTTLMSDTLDPSFKQGLVRCIHLSGDHYVMVIRVPKSWDGPHRIKKTSKFMVRTNANKIELTTSELKNKILMNSKNNIRNEYDEFREKRILKAKEHPQVKPPFILIHYVPISVFESSKMYPVVQKKAELDHSLFGSSHYIPITNSHGTIHQEFANIMKSHSNGHTQIFNNGIIEQISSYPFNYANEINLELPKDFFETIPFKEKLSIAFEKQSRNYEILKMKDPFYIFFEMVGVNGVVGYHLPPIGRYPIAIDEENLRMPEILIESFNEHQQNEAVERIMTFLWNTFGFDEPQTDHRLQGPYNFM